MLDGGPLISVVVPAFNAAATILETLKSVSQQTYRHLEVVVVDDGSTDNTVALIRRYISSDPRFRLILQPNGGVASARNAGIGASRGEFVAFIDADDLWHPTKIAKQIEALIAGGPDMALVYSPFRVIDAAGHVLGSPRKYGVSGWVLHRHFHTNLVGNGSALLIRRDVLEELGGFDSWLRHEGAEGCEDLLLQLRIAARYRFGEVSEYLVGYRRLPEAMSSNTEQMIRSGVLAVSKALVECRDVPGLSANAILKRYEWQRLKLSVRQRRVGESLLSFSRQFATSPAFVLDALWMDLVAITMKLYHAVANVRADASGTRSGDAPRHFYDFDPKSGIDFNQSTAMSRALRRLAKRDEAYRPATATSMACGARRYADETSEAVVSTSFKLPKFDCSRSFQEDQR